MVSPVVANMYKRSTHLMENQFEISVVHQDSNLANGYIDQAILEIKRMEQLLTTIEESRQTNQINKMAGISPVVVDEEIYRLIE